MRKTLLAVCVVLAFPMGADAFRLAPGESRWLPANTCEGSTVSTVRAYRGKRRIPTRFYDLVELADGYHYWDLGPHPPETGRGRFYVYSTYPRTIRVRVRC